MIDIQDISVFDKVRENLPAQEVSVNFNNDNLLTYTKTIKIASAKKPEIVPPQTDYISPDIKQYIDILNNGTMAEQENCMILIEDKFCTNPEAATQFFDSGITDALFAVIDKDISKLKGPTFTQKRLRKKWIEGKKLSDEEFKKCCIISDRDMAIKNKMRAVCCIANIQNLLYEEVVKRSDLKPSFYDLPAVPRLIDVYKNTPYEDVKECIVGAIYTPLNFPDFKQDVYEFLKQAEKSKSKRVRKLAKQCLQEK